MRIPTPPSLKILLLRAILTGALIVLTFDHIAGGDTILAAIGAGLIGWNIYLVHEDYIYLREEINDARRRDSSTT